jgi:hypothetical protein
MAALQSEMRTELTTLREQVADLLQRSQNHEHVHSQHQFDHETHEREHIEHTLRHRQLSSTLDISNRGLI